MCTNNQINPALHLHSLYQDITITKFTISRVCVILRIREGTCKQKEGAKAPSKSCLNKRTF